MKIPLEEYMHVTYEHKPTETVSAMTLTGIL